MKKLFLLAFIFVALPLFGQGIILNSNQVVRLLTNSAIAITDGDGTNTTLVNPALTGIPGGLWAFGFQGDSLFATTNTIAGAGNAWPDFFIRIPRYAVNQTNQSWAINGQTASSGLVLYAPTLGSFASLSNKVGFLGGGYNDVNGSTLTPTNSLFDTWTNMRSNNYTKIIAFTFPTNASWNATQAALGAQANEFIRQATNGSKVDGIVDMERFLTNDVTQTVGGAGDIHFNAENNQFIAETLVPLALGDLPASSYWSRIMAGAQQVVLDSSDGSDLSPEFISVGPATNGGTAIEIVVPGSSLGYSNTLGMWVRGSSFNPPGSLGDGYYWTVIGTANGGVVLQLVQKNSSSNPLLLSQWDMPSGIQSIYNGTRHYGITLFSNVVVAPASGNPTNSPAYAGQASLFLQSPVASPAQGSYGDGLWSGAFGVATNRMRAGLVPYQSGADNDQMGWSFWVTRTNTDVGFAYPALHLDHLGVLYGNGAGLSNIVAAQTNYINGTVATDLAADNLSSGLHIANTNNTAGTGNYGPLLTLGAADGTIQGRARAAIGSVQYGADNDQVGPVLLSTLGATDTDPMVEVARWEGRVLYTDGGGISNIVAATNFNHLLVSNNIASQIHIVSAASDATNYLLNAAFRSQHVEVSGNVRFVGLLNGQAGYENPVSICLSNITGNAYTVEFTNAFAILRGSTNEIPANGVAWIEGYVRGNRVTVGSIPEQ